MKFLKPILSITLALLTIWILAASAFAAENYIVLDGFAFDINSDNEATIHSYDNRTADVVIPQKLMGYDVVYIDDYAFFGNEVITSVSFKKADKLKRIGVNAFNGCTKLESVVIPSSVTELGFGVFQGCSNLKTVDPGSGIENIPSQCFFKCGKLAKIVIPGNVKSISARSFADCASLNDIEIPDSVSLIADDAFSDSGKAVIYCNQGSYAQQYAESIGIPNYKIIRDVQLGDVNLDGKVNILDATLVQKYRAGLKPLPHYRTVSCADVNSDGGVSLRDATLIQMYLAGYSVPYPIGELVD